jgi:hypothetical protein
MLNGSRTLLVVMVGVCYFIGVKVGWWKLDPEVGSLITLMAIGFLRMGVASLQPKPQQQEPKA